MPIPPVCPTPPVPGPGFAIKPTCPYINVQGAQCYFNERLNSWAWDSATPIDQLKALKMATRSINNLMFIGEKANKFQPNEFPRRGQTKVPDAIMMATCELALTFLDMVDANQEINNIATDSESFANVRTRYVRDFSLPHIRNGIPSAEAWALLMPYLMDPLTIKVKGRELVRYGYWTYIGGEGIVY